MWKSKALLNVHIDQHGFKPGLSTGLSFYEIYRSVIDFVTFTHTAGGGGWPTQHGSPWISMVPVYHLNVTAWDLVLNQKSLTLPPDQRTRDLVPNTVDTKRIGGNRGSMGYAANPGEGCGSQNHYQENIPSRSLTSAQSAVTRRGPGAICVSARCKPIASHNLKITLQCHLPSWGSLSESVRDGSEPERLSDVAATVAPNAQHEHSDASDSLKFGVGSQCRW